MDKRQETAVLSVFLNGEQAKSEIELLEKKAESLKEAIKKASKEGSEDIAKGLRKELVDTNKDIRALNTQVLNVSKVLDNLSIAKPKELRQTLVALNHQLRFDDIERGSDKWNQLQENIRRVKEELGKISDESKVAKKELGATAESGLSKWKGALMVFGGNLLTKAVSGISSLINKGKEWASTGIDMAAKAEGIITAFSKLDQPDLLKKLRTETKGLIADWKLMQSAVRAENFDIPVEKLGTLLKFAQQRAQETGESVDYLANSIITGLGRKSPLILDNLGISASKLQARAKETGDFMQATIDIVNEELEKQGDLALTSADKATQASVKWENAQVKMGQRLQWFGDLWNKISGSIADGISELIGDTRSLTEQYNDQIEKVADLEVNTFGLAKRYDELKSKTTLTADEQNELNKIMNTISGTIPGVVAEFDKYGNILSINTDKVYAYIEAEKARLQYVHKDAIEELKKQKKKLQKEYDTQESISQNGRYAFTGGGMFGGGTSYIDNSAETLQKAAEKVAKIGTDLQGIDAELARLTGTTMDEQLTAQKEMLINRQNFNAMNKAELNAWIKDEANAQSQHLAIAQSIYNSRFGDSTNINSGTRVESEQKKKMNAIIKELENSHLEEMTKIKQKYLAGDFATEQEYNQKILFLQDEYDVKRKEKLQKLQKSISDPNILVDLSKQIADIELKALDRRIVEKNQKQKDAAKKEQDLVLWNQEETKKIIESAFKYIDDLENKALLDALERRAKNIISEKEYQKELARIQIKYLKERLEVTGLTENQIDEIEQGILEKKKAEEERLIALRESLLGGDVWDKFQKKMDDIDDLLDSGMISFEDAIKLRIGAISEGIEYIVENISGNLTSAISNFQEAEISATERKYDKLIKAAGKNSKKAAKLEEEKEAEISRIKAKHADKQFILTVAQVISSTAVTAMEAYKAMAGIPVVGPALGVAAAGAALAYGASQIAVAKEQQEAAKASYWIGGFTPRGPWDKPQGTVHSEEFVGNRFAVRNPAAKKMFDVVDQAQRNNTVSSLTDEDFSRVLNYREAESRYFISGLSSAFNSGENESADNEALFYELSSWLGQNAETTKRLRERLDEPFETVNTVTGKRGIKQALDKYDKIVKNRSRK